MFDEQSEDEKNAGEESNGNDDDKKLPNQKDQIDSRSKPIQKQIKSRYEDNQLLNESMNY